MYQNFAKKSVICVGTIVFLWLTVRFLLPIALPFLLGALLAVSAEPTARLLRNRAGLPPAAATGVAVSGVFLLFGALITLLLAALLRQLGRLGGVLPELMDMVSQSAALLQDRLLQALQQLPEGIREVLLPLVGNLFSGGSALLEQAAMAVPRLATGMIGKLSGGLFGILTGLISGYMLSGRLSRLRQWFSRQVPQSLRERYIPALKTFRKAVGKWLLAQLKLAGVAFVLLSLGFLILGLPKGVLWAGLITLVDAFPVLGVGTVLLPWSVFCLVQGEVFRGVGLLAVYGVIWLVRSVLEPKILGKELGVDPLVMLICLYAGVKLLGFAGLLLSPLMAMLLTQVMKAAR